MIGNKRRISSPEKGISANKEKKHGKNTKDAQRLGIAAN